jgi:hypothetical protein
VKATRTGVHNGFSELVFLLACISYLTPIIPRLKHIIRN